MNYILSENTKIFITENSPVLITKSIADVLEPEKRKRDFTKEIEVPGTAENLAYFKGYFSFTSTDSGLNFDPTRKVSADYFSNENNIFKNCFLMLNKVTLRGGTFIFSVHLFSELKNLILEMRKYNVNELDFSAYNHVLNKANIISRQNITAGICYPLVDYGGRAVVDTWRTTDFRPFVKTGAILDRILLKIGVNPNPFIPSPSVLSILEEVFYGSGGGEIPNISPAEIASRKTDVDGTFNYSQPSIASEVTLLNIKNTLGATTTESVVTDPSNQYLNFEVYASKTGRYKITLEINGVATIAPYTSLAQENRSGIYKNGVLANYEYSTSENFTITNTAELDLNSGDRIDFTFTQMMGRTPSGLPFPNNADIFNLPTNIAWTHNIKLESLDEKIIDGATVDVAMSLPSMNCADFFNGLITLLNLYLTDSEDGDTYIDSLSKFYQTTTTAEDINMLVDESKDIEWIPLSNTFAKEIHFKYADNKDFENQTYIDKFGTSYGDLKITNQSDFATGEKIFKLPFANVIPCNSTPGVNAIHPRFVVSEANGTFKPNKGAPRIGFAVNLPSPSSYKLADSDGNNVEVRTTGCTLHHFDSITAPTLDLNFTLVSEMYYDVSNVTLNNRYNENYREFIEESTSADSRFLKCYIKYNDYDIKKLNLRQLRYYKGSYFRLNKIEDYNGNSDSPDTTKAELIKVLAPKVRPILEIPTVFQPAAPSPFNGEPIIEDVIVGDILTPITLPVTFSERPNIYVNVLDSSAFITMPSLESKYSTVTIFNKSSIGTYIYYGRLMISEMKANGTAIINWNGKGWNEFYTK